MYTIQASARTLSRIVRAKVLLIVAPPVLAPGLETILRLALFLGLGMLAARVAG